MSTILIVFIVTLLAGLAMPIGAACAAFKKIKTHWIEQETKHAIMAFSGGTLLSAIALILVPEGIANHTPWFASLCFITGGFAFMQLDIFLKKVETPASLLAAMLADFIPESIIVGAAFANGTNSAFLLAGLICLQNLPEGFNAHCELNTAHSYHKPKRIIVIFMLMSLLGPIAGVSGYLWLSDNLAIVGAIMLFASGGILYSIFQDIAPKVVLEKHWLPPMGAVFGFMFGMVGFMIMNRV